MAAIKAGVGIQDAKPMPVQVLTDHLRDYEQELAPGGETCLWDEFREWVRDVEIVPGNEVAWWIARYKSLTAAARQGCNVVQG